MLYSMKVLRIMYVKIIDVKIIDMKKVNLRYIINLSNPHHVRSIVKSIFMLACLHACPCPLCGPSYITCVHKITCVHNI